MSGFEAKINQLVVTVPGKKKIFIRAFTTKPSPELLNKYGKIFGLIEIESDNQKTEKLIDLIIEEIKNQYYLRRDVRLLDDTLPLSDQFELALKKTNVAIAAFLESEQINLNLEKINAIIAVSHHQELNFAVVGNIGATLYFNISNNNFRIINVIESTKTAFTCPDPLKFFSQIISGRIRPQDMILLSTSNLYDYFSLDRIKTLITTQPVVSGLYELKGSLEKLKAKENFGIMVLEIGKIAESNAELVPLEEFNYRQAANKDSMRELIKTEQATARLLMPSFLPEVKKISNLFGLAWSAAQNAGRGAVSVFAQKRKKIFRSNIKVLPGMKIPALPALKEAREKISRPIQPLIDKFNSTQRHLSNQAWWQQVKRFGEKLFSPWLARFKKLPTSSQYLLALTVILACLFAGSVYWLAVKNRHDALRDKFDQVVYEVEIKKNTAESSLIYRDENLARQLLVEARALLATVTPLTATQKERTNSLQTGIEEQLQKLRHVTVIAEPIQLFNFANLDAQSAIAPILLANRNYLYTQNQNNGTLYKANLETRAMAAIYSPAVNLGKLAYGVTVSDVEIILTNDKNEFFSLNPANDNMQKIKINFSAPADVSNLASFKSLLYVLDAKNNQIYRYAKSGDNWGNPKNWLKAAEPNLSGAVALTVDGSVYVLQTDGTIIKMENGKAVDFRVKTIEPAISQPTGIKTTESSKFLYVLDPKNQRLVVINKTDGNLTAQYYSPVFTELKDFLINENTKQIYLLNGTSIYGVPAGHF